MGQQWKNRYNNKKLTLVPTHTKSHQFPSQEHWSVRINSWTPPWSCSLLIWNSISTCPPIQTVSWHKHQGKPTPSGTCQHHIKVCSSADESHCDGLKLNFFYPFNTLWQSPDLFQVGVAPFFPISHLFCHFTYSVTWDQTWLPYL